MQRAHFRRLGARLYAEQVRQSLPFSWSAIGFFLTATLLSFLAIASPQPLAAERIADGQQSQLIQAADDYRQGDHASAWFRFWALAQKGHAAAQFNLGQLYREGHGVPVDLGLARYWYEEAAAQGHAYAQFNLGIMYERGDGMPTDLIEARAWYRRAAAQDIAAARAALERLERQERRRESRRATVPGIADANRDPPQPR